MPLSGSDYANPIELQPGEVRTLRIDITTAPNSSVLAYLDVQTPVNSSAVFTVYHIEVVSPDSTGTYSHVVALLNHFRHMNNTRVSTCLTTHA